MTHPDVRRYFMLIPEAVQLVLYAATLADSGAIYVLDMGDEFKILDLAHNLIRLAGYVPDEDIRIEITGLRPGEKLSEMLIGKGETLEAAVADKTWRVSSTDPSWEPAVLRSEIEHIESVAADGTLAEVISSLARLVPTLTQPLALAEDRSHEEV